MTTAVMRISFAIPQLSLLYFRIYGGGDFLFLVLEVVFDEV